MLKHDLVVIGGGTGGFLVAVGALRLGLKVILIEQQAYLGGLALNKGCVPSKTLLHVARVAHTLQQANEYGIENFVAPVNLGKVNKYVKQIVAQIGAQESYELLNIFQKLGGTIIYGSPQFIDANTIEINTVQLSAKKIVLATGSRPTLPTVPGLEQIGYITSDEVFSQQQLWQHLIILGDRPSAIEFAQAFSRFGCKVSIIAPSDSILPQEDPELVQKLEDYLLKSNIDIYLNSSVQQAYMERKQKLVECTHDSGKQFYIAGDQILVALGRAPNVAGLGLENAGIAYSKDGIIVDRRLRTSNKHVYALGDVIRSPYKLTHVTEYQASIVLSNMILRCPAKVSYQGFPYVIFTDPEYAHVGLSELQAQECGYKNLEIFKFNFKDLDSAIINNVAFGLVKVITSKNKIIGAAILGPNASNLIAEWGLAINMGASLSDVAATIHAYPTLAQINRRVASKQVVRGFFSNANRVFVSLMQRFRFLAWV